MDIKLGVSEAIVAIFPSSSVQHFLFHIEQYVDRQVQEQRLRLWSEDPLDRGIKKASQFLFTIISHSFPLFSLPFRPYWRNHLPAETNSNEI